jgi:predicted RNA-binding protein with PIN domain
MNGVRVCVAFDAMYNQFSNMGTSETLLESGVTVAYCGDKEADSFLTSQAKEWIKRGATQVVVATNDATLQVAVQSTRTEGPQVCFTVPSSGLINDMDRTEKRARAQVADGTGTPDLCLLETVVKSKDMDTFDKLQQLRQGLIHKR